MLVLILTRAFLSRKLLQYTFALKRYSMRSQRRIFVIKDLAHGGERWWAQKFFRRGTPDLLDSVGIGILYYLCVLGK